MIKHRRVIVVPLVCVTLMFSCHLMTALAKEEVESHLANGMKLLAAGQLADALTQFHAAIDGDPENYMSYYRRGTVYLGMGKFKSALTDLNRVVELKSDFTSVCDFFSFNSFLNFKHVT